VFGEGREAAGTFGSEFCYFPGGFPLIMPLIEFTDKGLYCPQGGFYIDPWGPVAKAVITHAHSDHARAGSDAYLCHRLTVPLLQLRLGPISKFTRGSNGASRFL
jgi:hypothetical protein